MTSGPQSHPDAERLRLYASRELPVDDLLVVDDHLAVCAACREHLPVGVPAIPWSAISLSASEEVDAHLSYEQLVAWVAGSSSLDERDLVAQHLEDCAACSAEERDLRAFVKSRRKSPLRYWPEVAMGLAAGLALVFALRWAYRPVPLAQVTPRAVTVVAKSRQIQDRWERLRPDELAVVQKVMETGRLNVTLPSSLGAGSNILLGKERKTDTDSGLSPVGVVVAEDRPVFHWSLPGATASVEIYDLQFHKVARSAPVHGDSWQPSKPLPRGRDYVWVLAVRRGRNVQRIPVPPNPEARFRVLSEQGATEVEHARATGSRLFFAATAAKWGLAESAQDALLQFKTANPQSHIEAATAKQKGN